MSSRLFYALARAIAVAALVVGGSAPAGAVPAPVHGPAEEDPDPLRAELEERVEEGGVTVRSEPVPVDEPLDEAVAAGPVRDPVFPEPVTVVLEVREVPPGEDRTEGSGSVLEGPAGAEGTVEVPLPVAVWRPPDDRGEGESVPSAVTVEVLDRDAVSVLGGVGLAFRLTRADGVGEPGAVVADAVYDAFRTAAGGSLPSRLRLVSLPDCALTRPEDPACREGTPVAAANDTANGWLRGLVAVDAAGRDRSGGRLVGLDDDPVMHIFAVQSMVACNSGTYAASPVAPTGQWTVGVGSGDFTWSESLPSVPLPAGGQSSAPALTYSSASVDGRTTSKNPQASWAGIGWELSTASVTQAFWSCEQADLPGGSDYCVYDGEQRYTLNLNGQSSPLV